MTERADRPFRPSRRSRTGAVGRPGPRSGPHPRGAKSEAEPPDSASRAAAPGALGAPRRGKRSPPDRVSCHAQRLALPEEAGGQRTAGGVWRSGERIMVADLRTALQRLSDLPDAVGQDHDLSRHRLPPRALVSRPRASRRPLAPATAAARMTGSSVITARSTQVFSRPGRKSCAPARLGRGPCCGGGAPCPSRCLL